MKIYSIGLNNPAFYGQRKDRKNVEQLKRNNPYTLNVINQRNIDESIQNLSEQAGESNIKFLLDVSRNLKYGTNIDLGKMPNHQWQVKLQEAARKSIERSPENIRPRLYAQLDKVTSTKKPLTKAEQQILKLREAILEKVDEECLNNIKNNNIRNFYNNFDYLISSSEITVTQKLHILKQLNFMMSPKYKINTQLENKKTQVLAEIVNDLVITTPESVIPNIKMVNQRATGICASISICRKALAYEDKTNYVDIVLSELDDNDNMMVYDISQLGSNKKIPVAKPYINYEYALQKGFRILDTAALNWMKVADTTGRTNEETQNYIGFDKEYFDTFTDIHIIKDINEELAPEQDYYRALLKTQSAIKACKKYNIKKHLKATSSRASKAADDRYQNRTLGVLETFLGEIAPNTTYEQQRLLAKQLIALNANSSSDIEKTKSENKPYMYISNEPEQAKIRKIKNFISKSIEHIDQEKLDTHAPELIDIIEILSPEAKSSNAGLRVRNAQRLYKAAAAYRIQYDFGLESIRRTSEYLNSLGLPDRESIIFQNIDNVIAKIDKGNLNPVVLKTLCENFGVENNDPEILKFALQENRKTLENIMTEGMDTLYKACLIPGRKGALLNNMIAARDAIAEENNKDALVNVALNMNMQADKVKVLKTLDKYIEVLGAENCSEEDYINIYNKMGCKNQMLDFKTVVESLFNIMNAGDERAKTVISGFNLVNGLAADAPIEATNQAYASLIDGFNQISMVTKTFQDMLEVRGENGEYLNPVTPKSTIMKKLEDMHEIVSEKDLKILQDRFTKIDNATMSPEGTTIYLKDLPAELTTFTKHEKEVLKTIEQNINGWHSSTTRNLDTQYKEIKEPLNEFYRSLGVLKGYHWVSNEGHTGLDTTQQIRIFESMTDRPYYVEHNGQTAISKILNSAYSGISSTSTQQNEPAWHAQYIVDIKPVNQAGNEEKPQYALFHDNTWGPAEHESSWIDENGLIRTDYGQEAGGKNGYIVDENFRTGTMVEELINGVGTNVVKQVDNKQYKKLTRDDEEYKFKMLSDIVTPGEYPNARETVNSLKHDTMATPYEYLEQLKKYAQNMTREELQAKFKAYELLGVGVDNHYEELEKRIMGDKQSKGIDSKEAYDKLPDDDELKLLMEKIAVFNSYPSIPDKKVLYAENLSPRNIERIKQLVKSEARKNFDYSLGKNIDITRSYYDSSANEILDILENFQINTHAKITHSQKLAIIQSLRKIDKSQFDGSMKKTINLMAESFRKSLSKNSLNFENKEEKLDEITQQVREILRKNMYLSVEELNSREFKRDNLPALEKWIEDTFDPVNDKEFVKIYNQLLDMPTKAFEEKYNHLITDEVLGIKPLTGYDMVKKFRAMDSGTQNYLYNMLYNNEFYNKMVMGKVNPAYDYGKRSRNVSGSTYSKGIRSFDDIYWSYYGSMISLTAEKMYGKFRNDAYKKYNLFPAYAKIDIENTEQVQELLQNLYNEISDSIDSIEQIKRTYTSIQNIKKMDKYINRFEDDARLSDSQYRHVMKYASEFVEQYLEDDTIQTSVNAAQSLLELEKDAPAKQYKDLIKIMFDEMTPFETLTSGEPIISQTKTNLQDIKTARNAFVNRVFEPKYRDNANVLINKWIQAKIKQNPDADRYYNEFEELYHKHKIILTPQNILKEYLLLHAKPKNEEEVANMTEEQKKYLEESREVYEENLKALLYSANLIEIQNTLMSCAKKGNLNIITRELKNTNIQLNNGRVIKLYSKEGLSILLNNMTDYDDTETVTLFLDQLGLNELAIDLYAKSVNFKAAKRVIKRTYNVFDAVNKQTKIVQSELAKLNDIDNDPNYKERILQAKENIVNRCKNTNFRLPISVLETAIDTSLKEMEANPKLPKLSLLTENMEYAKSGSIELAKRVAASMNAKLTKIQNIDKIVRAIKLPEGSPAAAEKEAFLAKMEDLENFTANTTNNFDQIEISLGAGA